MPYFIRKNQTALNSLGVRRLILLIITCWLQIFRKLDVHVVRYRAINAIHSAGGCSPLLNQLCETYFLVI